MGAAVCRRGCSSGFWACHGATGTRHGSGSRRSGSTGILSCPSPPSGTIAVEGGRLQLSDVLEEMSSDGAPRLAFVVADGADPLAVHQTVEGTESGASANELAPARCSQWPSSRWFMMATFSSFEQVALGAHLLELLQIGVGGDALAVALVGELAHLGDVVLEVLSGGGHCFSAFVRESRRVGEHDRQNSVRECEEAKAGSGVAAGGAFRGEPAAEPKAGNSALRDRLSSAYPWGVNRRSYLLG